MSRSKRVVGLKPRRNEHFPVPAGAPPWITPELLEATLETWQPHYDKPLTSEDALEILLNVDHLLAVLEDSGNDQNEIRRAGPRLQP
jgi:hypothetical protein